MVSINDIPVRRTTAKESLRGLFLAPLIVPSNTTSIAQRFPESSQRTSLQEGDEQKTASDLEEFNSRSSSKYSVNRSPLPLDPQPTFELTGPGYRVLRRPADDEVDGEQSGAPQRHRRQLRFHAHEPQSFAARVYYKVGKADLTSDQSSPGALPLLIYDSESGSLDSSEGPPSPTTSEDNVVGVVENGVSKEPLDETPVSFSKVVLTKFTNPPRYKPKKVKFHQCTICQKSFPRPSGLRTHMNIHTNTRPYRCPFKGCDKTFSVISNAKRHYRTHSNSSHSDRGWSNSSRSTMWQQDDIDIDTEVADAHSISARNVPLESYTEVSFSEPIVLDTSATPSSRSSLSPIVVAVGPPSAITLPPLSSITAHLRGWNARASGPTSDCSDEGSASPSSEVEELISHSPMRSRHERSIQRGRARTAESSTSLRWRPMRAGGRAGTL